MAQVFISYSHADESFVDELHKQLLNVGYDVWIDKELLKPGRDWRTEIDNAIKASFAVIVVMTPEAYASPYVTYEWAFGWGQGKAIFPILLKKSELHPRLEAFQYIDYTDHFNIDWDRLLVPLAQTLANMEAGGEAIPYYIQEMQKALYSYDRDVRNSAITTLAQTQHPAATKVLKTALEHPMPDVRWMVINEISRRGITSAIPELIDLVQHNNDDFLIVAAIDAIATIGSKDEQNRLFLRELLSGDSVKVKEAVVKALSRLEDEYAITQIPSILANETDKGIMLACIKYIRQMGHDTEFVRSLLLRLSTHQLKDVRTAALQALAAFKERKAIPIIRELFRVDRNETDLIYVGINAIVELEANDFGVAESLFYLIKWHYNRNIKKAAIKAIGKLNLISLIGLEELWNAVGVYESDADIQIEVAIVAIKASPDAGYKEFEQWEKKLRPSDRDVLYKRLAEEGLR